MNVDTITIGKEAMLEWSSLYDVQILVISEIVSGVDFFTLLVLKCKEYV
jgi:hypothetical protein